MTAARFPRDHDTDQSFCPQCGDPDAKPVEVFGMTVCADCAAQSFDITQTGEPHDPPPSPRLG